MTTESKRILQPFIEMKSRAFSCLMTAFCLPVLFACISIQAQPYFEITATIETLNYEKTNLNEGINPIRNSFPIVCVAGANKWRIDVLKTNSEIRCQFDGVNLYRTLIVADPHPMTEGDSTYLKVTNANLPPRLNPGSVHCSTIAEMEPSLAGCPLGGFYETLPWLAFCSGKYLKRTGRLIPLPIVSAHYAPDSFAYTDQIKTFGGELGLPETISLFTSNSLFDKSVTNGVFVGAKDPALWRAGCEGFKWDLPDGSLHFQYTVTASTNFLGCQIPLKAEWFLNIPQSAKLVPLGNLQVTSLKVSGKPQSVVPQNTIPTVRGKPQQNEHADLFGLAK